MEQERTQNPDDEQLPGSVSNQNGEEQLSEEQLSEEQGAGGHSRPPARDRGDDPSRGEAGEGTQSTGSPTSAG